MASTCPSCGSPVEETGDRCQRCGSATTRRYIGTGNTPAHNPAVPPPEIAFPCLVTDARFTVGEAWTHGVLYLTDLGVFFLAEGDGPWTPEKLMTITPPDPGKPTRIGEASGYVPLNRIERFQHSRLTSYSLRTREGRKPMRLTAEGWRMIDAFGAKMGIPTT